MARRGIGKPGASLTPMELRILQLQSEGSTAEEIANKLGYSEGGIKGAQRVIYEKLGLFVQEEQSGIPMRYKQCNAVHLAIERQLIVGPPPLEDRHRQALTRGEIEVIYLLRFGWTKEQIAEKLSLTVAAVKERLHKAYSKIGTSSPVLLMVYVVFHKIDQ